MLPGTPKTLWDEDIDVKDVTCGGLGSVCGARNLAGGADVKTPEHTGG